MIDQHELGILCPWPSGPCPVHGPAHDHRVAVNL